MTDFTKEELEWLTHEIQVIVYGCPHTHKISKPIYDKLKSMIENFDRDKKVKDNLNYIVEKARGWDLKL